MPDTTILMLGAAALLATIAAGICVLVLSRQYRRRQRNLQIARQLDIVRLAANEKRLHPDEKAQVDVDGALTALETLIHGTPTSVHVDLEEIRERWEALNLQLREFSEQTTVSTLRSSIVTTRTDRLANEIMELAKHMETRLD